MLEDEEHGAAADTQTYTHTHIKLKENFVVSRADTRCLKFFSCFHFLLHIRCVGGMACVMSAARPATATTTITTATTPATSTR